MSALVRVTLSRAKGWRMPENTVKVDRSTKWGNPFRVGAVVVGRSPIDQAGAVQMFRDMLADPQMRRWLEYPSDLTPLRGRNLACWCKPGEPCHADVLLAIANAPAVPA